MSKYLELKNNNQKRFYDFSEKHIYWIFAFSSKEFENKLKEHGLTKDEITSIGAGGCIKKENRELYLNEMNRLNNYDPFKQIIHDDDDEVKKAFIYELANHEYCITYNVDDTLDALGITYDELTNDERLKRILKEAVNEYLEDRDNF